MSSQSIRLLVSVRDPEEAMAAVQGEADIIDVKEPRNGSLGRASCETIRMVADALAATPEIPLSLALGELAEWQNESAALIAELQHTLTRTRPRYVKLGLSGFVNHSNSGVRSKDCWMDRWHEFRKSTSDVQSWVAVAYADHVRAAAPDPETICAVAIATGCKVLLLDTFVKDGSTLTDCLETSRLKELRSRTSSAGVLLAFAGRITEELLPQLTPLAPDIVAVRGAVCENGNRTAPICANRIRRFKERLHGG